MPHAHFCPSRPRILFPLAMAMASAVAWIFGDFAVAEVPADSDVRLDKPKLVTLKLQSKPLASALASIEQQTNVAVTIDSILPKPKQIGKRLVAINATHRPFWDVIDRLIEQANLQVDTIERDRVVLKEFSFPEHTSPAGESRYCGAFQITPMWDAFFDELEIRIRPDPRIPMPRVVDYRAKLSFGGDDIEEYHPRPLGHRYPLPPSNEFAVRIENGPSFGRQIFKGHQRAEEIELTVEIEVPTGWESFTLPPLSKVQPKRIQVRDGELWVERAGKQDPRYGHKRPVRIHLRTKGVTKGEKESLKAYLISPEGKPLDPGVRGVSRGDDDGVQWRFVDIGYDVEDVPHDLDDYDLAVRMDDGEEINVGRLGDLRPKPVAAGEARINFDTVQIKTGSGLGLPKKTLEVELSVEQFRIPYDRIRLDVGKGEPRELAGSGRGDGYPYTMSVLFSLDGVDTPPSQWRLVLWAPTQSLEQTLQVKLNDVRLGEAEKNAK